MLLRQTTPVRPGTVLLDEPTYLHPARIASTVYSRPFLFIPVRLPKPPWLLSTDPTCPILISPTRRSAPFQLYPFHADTLIQVVPTPSTILALPRLIDKPCHTASNRLDCPFPPVPIQSESTIQILPGPSAHIQLDQPGYALPVQANSTYQAKPTRADSTIHSATIHAHLTSHAGSLPDPFYPTRLARPTLAAATGPFEPRLSISTCHSSSLLVYPARRAEPVWTTPSPLDGPRPIKPIRSCSTDPATTLPLDTPTRTQSIPIDSPCRTEPCRLDSLAQASSFLLRGLTSPS